MTSLNRRPSWSWADRSHPAWPSGVPPSILVVVAPDGPEALEIIDQHEPFDLFIVDIIMPRMRGDELGRRIRARNPSAKLLYFTGYVGHLFDERKQAWTDEPFVAK